MTTTRGFYKDIQFLWSFGGDESVKALSEKCVKYDAYDGRLPSGNVIKGFIAGVFKPEMLNIDGDNNNTVTLMANGRIFVEDVQKSIDDSKVFNSYLVGELQADFFDDNDKEDMAVSSRQGVIENDPRYEEVIAYIKTRLTEIGDKWTEWRRELGSQDVEDQFPKVTEWYGTLKPRLRTKARQLIGKIATTRFQGTEEEQYIQRKELIRHQILAFEKLAVTDNLDLIGSIDIEKNISEFRDVIVSIEDIEASMHHTIFEQRLAVIRKLREQADDKVKEKVVQEHIYEHLWLIDPTFSSVGEVQMERTMTEYLKRVCPDTSDGARLDIAYRNTSGKYIIIELKRPGLSVSFDKLFAQAKKYVLAVKQYFHENPDSCPNYGSIPAVEVILLVEKNPVRDVEFERDIQNDQLKSINAQVKTYRDLINQAEKAYDDQIQVLEKVDKLRKITENL